MISFEDFVSFTGNSPKDEINYLRAVESEQIQKLLNRSISNSCDIISFLPITDEQKAYKVFISLFDGFETKLNPTHLSFIKTDCKNSIFRVTNNNRNKPVARDNSIDSRVQDIIQEVSNYHSSANNTHTIENDSLLQEAIKFVVESGQASTSLLQRQLKVGYARAGRMIDDMEQLGIVGPHQGAKPRKVLMTYNEWLDNSLIRNSSDLEKRNHEERHQLELLFSKIRDEIPVCEEDILENQLGIKANYEQDGFFVEELDNFIIPKSDDNTQIQFINNTIRYASSSTVKIILIDEGLAFDNYKGIPHLLVPIISDTTKGMGAINWLNSELKQRQRICSEYKCRGIDSFNKLIDKNISFIGSSSNGIDSNSVFDNQPCLEIEGLKVPTQHMYHIVLLINEFYHFCNFSELDESMIPLLLNSKQFGIHLYLFSKFAIKNLSLGVKADLLKIGDEDDLQAIFIKGENEEKTVSIDKIDYEMNGYQFEVFCGELLRRNGLQKLKSLNLVLTTVQM